MATGSWLLAFTAGVAVSLAASWLLVSRLERLGERAGFPEAWLGLLAAVAADAPEIRTVSSARRRCSHQERRRTRLTAAGDAKGQIAATGLSGVAVSLRGLTWQSLARVRSKRSGRSRSVVGLRRAHARVTACPSFRPLPALPLSGRELTKTRNRWSGVRITSVSAITPQPS